MPAGGSGRNTVVMGGSSGGFTALEAVAAEPAPFAAAVVLYPVTDLLDLAERSHRFERHYTDSLIGPLPAAQRRVSRSDHRSCTPIDSRNAAADLARRRRPGRAGRAEHACSPSVCALPAAIVELQVYEGEGHGFRQPANQLDEYRRIADFLARHVPLASAP